MIVFLSNTDALRMDINCVLHLFELDISAGTKARELIMRKTNDAIIIAKSLFRRQCLLLSQEMRLEEEQLVIEAEKKRLEGNSHFVSRRCVG